MNSTIVKALRAQAADLQRDKTASVSDTMGSWPARFADALGSQTRPIEHWGPVAISTAIQSSSRGYDTPGAATTLRPSIPVSPPVVSDAALTVRNAAVGLSNKTGDNGYALHVTEGITRTDELWCLRWGKVHSSGTDGSYTYVDCYECEHADGHPTAISDVNVRVFVPTGTTIDTNTLIGYLRDRDGLAFWVGAAAGTGDVILGDSGGGEVGDASLVFFELTEALTPGGNADAARLVDSEGAWVVDDEDTFTVYDDLGCFRGRAPSEGVNGSRGFATLLGERYSIVNLQPHAQIIKASVNEAGGVLTSDDDFAVDGVTAFLPEGSIIVSTPSSADNYFHWEIADDGLVLLAWNGSTWDAIQAECPY